MQYYIPKTLPEYRGTLSAIWSLSANRTICVTPARWCLPCCVAKRCSLRQPATVASLQGWKTSGSTSTYPYLVRLGDLEKFRFLLDR
jgi:hypothetical protein